MSAPKSVDERVEAIESELPSEWEATVEVSRDAGPAAIGRIRVQGVTPDALETEVRANLPDGVTAGPAHDPINSKSVTITLHDE